jgi:hypothetical protein
MVFLDTIWDLGFFMHSALKKKAFSDEKDHCTYNAFILCLF